MAFPPQVMPSLSAVPGMSSTPSIKAMSHSSVPGRTGAKPTRSYRRSPSSPVAGRGLQNLVPADLAVVVSVQVDEAGATILPVASIVCAASPCSGASPGPDA